MLYERWTGVVDVGVWGCVLPTSETIPCPQTVTTVTSYVRGPELRVTALLRGLTALLPPLTLIAVRKESFMH